MLRPCRPSMGVSSPSGLKSLKKSSWAFWPRVSKKSRKGRRVPESLQNASFWGPYLFGTFFGVWAARPGKTLLRLFSPVFGPEGRGSCRWAAGTQLESSLWNTSSRNPCGSFLARFLLLDRGLISPFFPRDTGKLAIFMGIASKWPFSLSHGKKTACRRE